MEFLFKVVCHCFLYKFSAITSQMDFVSCLLLVLASADALIVNGTVFYLACVITEVFHSDVEILFA